jgi:ribonuclease Z
MTIRFQILGAPERDNALLVHLDSGQAVTRLLFDCGEGCLAALPLAEIQAIDQVCFSHLHMDHVGGFDTFFRATYDRTAQPNIIWGPPETATILQHRFRGYLWNLHEGLAASWHVRDVYPDHIRMHRFELAEAFGQDHDEGAVPCHSTLLDTAQYQLQALAMDHRTPSLAYIVREKPRQNIDTARLQQLGLRPGPWLKQLKDAAPEVTTVDVAGQVRSVAELRQALLVETPGDSIAYLTDFLLDELALGRLVPALQGCRVLVCESQYRQQDEELARRNFHMTAVQVGELARRAGVGELVLFHLSGRYTRAEWPLLLDEARAVFPAARFPEHWGFA